MGNARFSFSGLIVFSLVLLTFGMAVYVTLNLEPVSRRLDVLPYYARTYLNKVRPKPALPTPPAQSDIDTGTLLQTRPGSVSQAESQVSQANLGAPSQGSDVPVPDQPPSVRLAESNVIEMAPVAPEIKLAGFNHEWQTWNNCGPATVSMNLSYYGHPDTQVEAAQFLKPNQDDKNVNPDEMLAYVRSLGFEGVVGYGGNVDTLKRFLSNGLPVVVEAWTELEDNGGMGHYQLLTGYSQAGNQFLVEDSLHGASVTIPIDEFDRFWRVFNRTYMVVYPPDQAAMVYAILGSSGDRNAMYHQALSTSQSEAQASPDDAFAWFNVGTNYARLSEPALAASAFDVARRLGLPYRMLWYQFDLFEAYLAMQRYQEVIELTTATLKATGGLEELYYYRGLALLATDQPQAAAEDFEAALAYHPHFAPAVIALESLDN